MTIQFNCSRVARWAVLMLFAGILPMPAHAVPPGGVSNSAEIRDSGEIRGKLELCTPEAAAGMIVYIPGQSFSAITGTGGEFILRYVPKGTYNLVIMKNGQVLRTLGGVAVVPKTGTNVGAIDLSDDRDNDGYNACVDCDDLNPAVNPGASELCDGKDNNCDGSVDEGCPTCTDADQDGYFAQAGCGTPVDCNDSNAAVNPGAQEACLDGIDNNCDGQVDEGCQACTPGTACGSSLGQCQSVFDGNCNCVQSVGPSSEVCDGIDNDCDGQVDEGLPTNWTPMQNGSWACTQGNIQISCNLGFADCDGSIANGCEQGGMICP